MATTQTISFSEFEKLPNLAAGYYELRHGEVVQVPPAVHKHRIVQDRLVELLRPMATAPVYISVEFAFRALPEGEYRVADVVVLSLDRYNQIDPTGYLEGAPDIVIEVLSPSNTMAEMLDKEAICLGNGCREFWIVDAVRRQIKISRPDGITTTYHDGQQIPSPLLGENNLAVADVFTS
jgi:Uma2 family endonuclease